MYDQPLIKTVGPESLVQFPGDSFHILLKLIAREIKCV